jgi:hypothetical protein
MGLPSQTLATYEAVGNREDLSDIIYDVTPTETPYLSSMPKGDAEATKHEWLTRSLAAASGSNAVLEGDDATTDAANANVRLDNMCQISDKVARVSGTQEAVKKAGMKSVMAREMADKMKELKRDVEMTLLQDVAKVTGNDSTARKCGGLSTYIKTNIDKASDGTASAGTGADTYTEGTARVLAESSVEAALALAWTNGGTPTKGFLNAFQKRKFASFSGNATRTSNGDGKRVVNSVDVYIDPLGNEISLVPCRQMPTDRIYFIDPEYVKFCTLRDFFSTELAKTGDSTQKQILVEYTQEVCNEKAHAAIFDLTTS